MLWRRPPQPFTNNDSIDPCFRQPLSKAPYTWQSLRLDISLRPLIYDLLLSLYDYKTNTLPILCKAIQILLVICIIVSSFPCFPSFIHTDLPQPKIASPLAYPLLLQRRLVFPHACLFSPLIVVDVSIGFALLSLAYDYANMPYRRLVAWRFCSFVVIGSTVSSESMQGGYRWDYMDGRLDDRPVVGVCLKVGEHGGGGIGWAEHEGLAKLLSEVDDDEVTCCHQTEGRSVFHNARSCIEANDG